MIALESGKIHVLEMVFGHAGKILDRHPHANVFRCTHETA